MTRCGGVVRLSEAEFLRLVHGKQYEGSFIDGVPIKQVETKVKGGKIMSNTITVSCYKKGCEWTHKVEMTNLTESLPKGLGKATISVYIGDDKADEFRVTLCPEHTTELLETLKPKEPTKVEGPQGSGA